MIKVTFFSRLLTLPLLFALAGCADLRLVQSEDEAIVRIGVHPVEGDVPVAKHIGNYTPYAVLAAKAYENFDRRGKPDGSTPFMDADGRSRVGQARDWLKPWRFQFGEIGPLCEGDARDCGVPGLAYQVWSRQASRRCEEVAVVFRGTDAGSLGDWLSNFHPVLRNLPINDQYEQVQSHMDRIVRRIKNLPCVTPSTRLVTVGHSLGGGLAQQAAYMDPRVQRAYAFDPSPVTGWADAHTIYRDQPWPLVIDRVYEHGEVLAYLRFVLRQFVPPTDCDPRIRSFRVDLIHGNPIFQHSMDELAASLLERSGRPYDPAYAQPLPGWSSDEGAACRQAPETVVARR